MQLKSALGHVFVHSASHLGFSTDKNRPSLRKVAELELIADGDDGQSYKFRAEHLDKLAKTLRLRTKPQYSEAEKQRRRELSLKALSRKGPDTEHPFERQTSPNRKNGIGTPSANPRRF